MVNGAGTVTDLEENVIKFQCHSNEILLNLSKIDKFENQFMGSMK